MKIIDEFTALAVSRQRKLQLRWHRDGKCITCGHPLTPGRDKYRCERHATANREYIRARNGCQPWQPGKVGRPPLEQRKAVA